MKLYIVFILIAWIHCFVYISKVLVTKGSIHFVFIIFVSGSMLQQVAQVLQVSHGLFSLSDVCRSRTVH